MTVNGVESARILVSWPDAQPYRTMAEVPRRQRSRYRLMGGVPTDFSRIDPTIALLAARGIRILPVVAHAPGWASANVFQIGANPRDLEAYGRFVALLVHRYGPRGTFWRTHRAPFSTRFRQWQIWNEPDLPFAWTDQARNFAPEYVALLRVARQHVKRADPRAQIVLGGLTSSQTWPYVWGALDAVYRAGGRGLFDVAAIHPFTRTPRGVLEVVRRTRAVMASHGDGRLPLLITEFSWSSRRGRGRRLASWEVSRAQQARNLAETYTLFVRYQRSLRIRGAYWFAWMTIDRNPFWSYWAGLRKAVGGQGESKPALSAFRRTAQRFEGCRKVTLATRCRQ